MRLLRPWLWCCLLGLLLGLPAAAVGTVLLEHRTDGGRERYEIGPSVAILEDPGARWTIEEITAPEFLSSFSPTDSPTLNLGISRSTYWIRFPIQLGPHGSLPEKDRSPWLLDIGWPFFADVDAYLVNGQKGDDQTIVPFRCSEALFANGGCFRDGQGLVGRLPPLTAEEQTVYLRLRADGVFFLYPVICTVKNYLTTSTVRMLWFGLYFGLLLALLLYNLLLYFCLRDRSYLWYVTAMAAIGLYFLGVNRLTYEFLLDYPPLDALRFNLASLSVSLIALVVFARSFLRTRERAPRIDRVSKGLLILQAAALLLVPFAPIDFLNRCYLVVGGLVPVVLIAAAWICWRTGYRPARFLVLSWTLYGLSGVIYGLTFQGWLPFNTLSFYSFQFGSALEAVLLSFALADRINLLRLEREELSQSERRHKELAVTDALTELYNRRYFEAQIDLEIERADRLGQKLTLMMLDVDNFKDYNDRYGHQEGDRVLSVLGRIMLSCVRGDDMPCRYGGEEFAIILPGGQNSTAVEIYERINNELLACQVGSGGRQAAVITMSIGVAEHLPGELAENLVCRADQALYEAKARGRNQIVIASREPEAVFFSCIGAPLPDDQPSIQP